MLVGVLWVGGGRGGGGVGGGGAHALLHIL
jgi:hypothetical protein